MKLYYPPVT